MQRAGSCLSIHSAACKGQVNLAKSWKRPERLICTVRILGLLTRFGTTDPAVSKASSRFNQQRAFVRKWEEAWGKRFNLQRFIAVKVQNLSLFIHSLSHSPAQFRCEGNPPDTGFHWLTSPSGDNLLTITIFRLSSRTSSHLMQTNFNLENANKILKVFLSYSLAALITHSISCSLSRSRHLLWH